MENKIISKDILKSRQMFEREAMLYLYCFSSPTGKNKISQVWVFVGEKGWGSDAIFNFLYSHKSNIRTEFPDDFPVYGYGL